MSSDAEDEIATTSEVANIAPHDTPVPDAFAAFMETGWSEPSETLPDLDAVAPFTAARRAQLVERFPNEVLVVPTGNYKVRANDTDYVFRAGSDFFWLTDCHEPDAVLVIDTTGDDRIDTL